MNCQMLRLKASVNYIFHIADISKKLVSIAQNAFISLNYLWFLMILFPKYFDENIFHCLLLMRVGMQKKIRKTIFLHFLLHFFL